MINNKRISKLKRDIYKKFGDEKASSVIIPDDIPYSKRIAEGYLNNPKEPFKNFTNEELKEILAE